MVIPDEKKILLDEAFGEVREVEDQYSEGLITSGEKYNKVVDIWAATTESVAEEMMKEIPRIVERIGKIKKRQPKIGERISVTPLPAGPALSK